jgi:hypothetical protein
MNIAIASRAIPMMDIKIVISPLWVQFNPHYMGQISGTVYPHVPIAYL